MFKKMVEQRGVSYGDSVMFALDAGAIMRSGSRARRPQTRRMRMQRRRLAMRLAPLKPLRQPPILRPPILQPPNPNEGMQRERLGWRLPVQPPTPLFNIPKSSFCWPPMRGC